jgi:hypothetical protein
LKKFSSSLFLPKLPKNKLKMIDSIGFGNLQKVFLIFEKSFWPENMTSLIALSCENNKDDNKEMENMKESLHTLQPHPWAKERVKFFFIKLRVYWALIIYFMNFYFILRYLFFGFLATALV